MPEEIIYLLLGLVLGLGLLLFYKQNSVSKGTFEDVQQQLKESEIKLALQNDRYNNSFSELEKNRQLLKENQEKHGNLIRENASLTASIQKLDQFHDQITKNHEKEKQINQVQQEEINRLSRITSDLNAHRNFLEEKLNNQKTEIEEFRRTSQLEFQNIANKILDEKVSKFTQTNKDNIDTILKPLGENLEQFKKKVEETYDLESKQRFSLEEKVRELMEHSNRISLEANNLTNALKGQSKKQGNWGEIILESILEKSGLQKHREYEIQPTFQNEEGQTLRPDVIIYLPEERNIIVDSKVSLVAYDRYCSSELKEEQDIHLSLHLKSIYQHIDDLSKKRYDELTTGLDFMMMFIPIEPAYLLAIQEDQNLWLYAYNKRILLISPTNLITALKLVTDLWKRDQQSKNAIEIAKQGERLYEKIVGFLETMDDVEKNITRTQDTFLKAKKQLRDGKGNLVSQAQRLKNMGINSEKELPGILFTNDLEDSES